ncbi:hypothetical protein CJF32_00009559 [Rutstroemia sp. NJR-2017a WRK4]|nr:hypothetical protein CJF32_00009559 [Rutstroemia sp. NJR-2017a WRK4]
MNGSAEFYMPNLIRICAWKKSIRTSLYSKNISAKFPSSENDEEYYIENCDEQSIKNCDEVYPYSISNSIDKFVLTKEDIDYIMKPPIAEICRYIADYLSGIKLDIVVLLGGISEMVYLRDSLREMLKGKGVLKNDGNIIYNPVYSTLNLGMSIGSPIKIASKKGVCISGGVQIIDIYYDVDTNRTTLDLSPIDIYTPNTDESIEGKYRVWIQLGFKVGMEIIVEVFWRYDGYKCTAETSEFSVNCQVKIPDILLLNEFRSPV